MADIQEHASPVVYGIDVQPHTQCAHWHSERDIVAIRHKCCGEFYACITCHAELAGHPPACWPKTERGTAAVLCGRCRRQLSISEYLSSSDNACPGCQAAFNPGCARHYHLYFEM